MDIVEFIAIWTIISLVVGVLVGRAMFRLDKNGSLADSGLIENILPSDFLADDSQPHDRPMS